MGRRRGGEEAKERMEEPRRDEIRNEKKKSKEYDKAV